MASNTKKPYCDRISAFWDNEKSSPSVVPRLLYMEIDQLCLNCPPGGAAMSIGGIAGSDAGGPSSGTPSTPAHAGPVYLAIKMPAQRTLRSQQIPPPLPNSAAQERRVLVEIQYPHAIKRDNPLLVMLQRRRKYRNLGFKTLGAACINLTDIMQMRLTDTRLPLMPDSDVAQRKQQPSHQQQPIGYLHIVRLETLPAPLPGTAAAAARTGKSLAAAPAVEDDDYLGAGSEDEEAAADEEDAAAAVAAKAKKEAVFGAKPKEWRQKLKLFMDESFSTILKSRKLKPGHSYELELQQDESLWNDLDDVEPPDSSSSLEDDDDVSIGSTPKPSVRRYFGSQSSDCRLTHPQQQQPQQLPQQQQQPQPQWTGRQVHSWAHQHTQPSSSVLLMPTNEPQQLQQQSSELLEQPMMSEAASFDVAAGATSSALAATATVAASTFASEPEGSSPPANSFDATRRQSQELGSCAAPATPAKLPPLVLLQQQLPLLSPPLPPAATTHSLSVTDDLRHHSASLHQQHRHRARSQTANSAVAVTAATGAGAVAVAAGAVAKPSPGGRRRSLASQRELITAHGMRQVVACRGAQGFQLDFNLTDPFFGEPRKECTEAVARLHGDCLPEKLCLINTGESGGRALLEALQQQQLPDSPVTAPLVCIPTVTAADCRHALAFIASALGHQSSAAAAAAAASAGSAPSASSKPAVHRICIAGSDFHVNSVLRAFVEQFGSKPAAWQSRVRFYYAPLLGSVALARLLCSADVPDGYGALWGDSISGMASALEVATGGWSAHETAQKIRRYLAEADTQLRLPVGEVLLAESADGAQTFVPFVLHVRLGQADRTAESDSELPSAVEEQQLCQQQQQQTTPPGSPSMEACRPTVSGGDPSGAGGTGEFVDLQLDYWTGGSDRRTALKPALRALRVCQAANGRGLSLSLVNKRQKIMRLGKKAKEPESRREVVEGLTRLICTGKSQPMRVFVDGVEWSGVKFFQLSSQWQTSVKFLPVAVYSLSHGNNGIC